MSEAAARPRGPVPPIPLNLITGCLGAGKTTLLNRLLRDSALAQAAVIINEFGEIGLDHLLVEHVEDGVMLLATGCLCCTARGDLVNTLEKLLRGLDNGRMSFNRVVIETTGLADPAPVLHTIMVHPYMQLRFRLDGVATLVDAVNGAATLDAHQEAVKQAAVADRIVLTKTDLIDTPERRSALAALRERLAALNPAAPVIEAAGASVAQLIDCGLYDAERKIPDVKRWLAEEAYAQDEHHHHHDVNRVMVHLDAGHQRIAYPDGKVKAIVFKAGDVRWDPAVGTHTSENLGTEHTEVAEMSIRSVQSHALGLHDVSNGNLRRLSKPTV